VAPVATQLRRLAGNGGGDLTDLAKSLKVGRFLPYC